MKNDAQIKVTCLTNANQKDEFHFDYYDKDGSIVGTVAVDEDGKLGWSIWNNEYKENILDNASCIYGSKVDNTLEYVLSAKEPDKIRFIRAEDYINSRGLYINYVNRNFEREFNNRPMR